MRPSHMNLFYDRDAHGAGSAFDLLHSAINIEGAMKQIEGTARSMGVTIVE